MGGVGTTRVCGVAVGVELGGSGGPDVDLVEGLGLGLGTAVMGFGRVVVLGVACVPVAVVVRARSVVVTIFDAVSGVVSEVAPEAHAPRNRQTDNVTPTLRSQKPNRQRNLPIASRRFT